MSERNDNDDNVPSAAIEKGSLFDTLVESSAADDASESFAEKDAEASLVVSRDAPNGGP